MSLFSWFSFWESDSNSTTQPVSQSQTQEAPNTVRYSPYDSRSTAHKVDFLFATSLFDNEPDTYQHFECAAK